MRRMRFIHRFCLLGLIFIFFAVGFGEPKAAFGSPPVKKDCSQGDVYERLECRQAALADQLEYTSDTVFAEGTKLHQRTKPARIKRIKNAKNKALRAKSKNTKETFKRHAKTEAKGNQKGGHLIPLSAADDLDSDGICDYEQGDENAKCAAIDLDASGNLQACNPKKKNKGKGKGGGNPKFDGLECDMFYDSDEASTPSEEEDMKQAAEQLDATYSATEDDLIEMNNHLETVNNNLPDSTIVSLNAEDSCDLPTLTPGLAEAVATLRGIHAGLFGGARISSAWFGQTGVVFGFGGNARGLAATFDIAALVANVAYITLDEIHKSESGELQSAISQCVSQSAGEISSLQAQITSLQVLLREEHYEIRANDNANTAAIKTKLENMRGEIINILNTPLGQRSGFPNTSN